MNYLCHATKLMGVFQCEEPVSLQTQNAFIQHINEFGLSYGTTAEFNFRLQRFAKADAEINEINAKQDSYVVGHNQFSTYTEEEMKKMAGLKLPEKNEMGEEHTMETTNIAEEVNWLDEGMVGDIRNQGSCGSCWAFSSLNAMESRNAIKYGTLYDLSEQQYVDCVDKAHGCNGGWMGYAFEYNEDVSQWEEKDYKYTAKAAKCQAQNSYKKKRNGRVFSKSHRIVPAQSVDQLKAAIMEGPVATCVRSAYRGFQNYKSGIMMDTACGSNVDHAVNAVGYGSEDGQEYYLVRNSWGTWWGDEGYVKIGIVPGKGICGIQTWSVYPTIA
jgi:cathepsin L